MSHITIYQTAFEIWGAIFCFICGMIVYASRKEERKRNIFLAMALFVVTVQLVSDALAITFRGDVSYLAYYIVRISNFLVFFSNFIMGMLLTLYITDMVKDIKPKSRKIWLRIVGSIGIVGITLLIISQFTDLYYYFDENNIYHRSDFFWINMVLAMLIIVVSAIMLLHYRKKLDTIYLVSLLIYVLLPFAMSVVQIFVYGISLTNITNAIAILLIFVVHEADKSQRIISQEQLVVEQQIELSETKIDLMVSQIQPHFISNTLIMIQGMYHNDLENADKVMNSFIHYLQQSFSDLSRNKPVEFSKDLSHVQNYTTIINQRWSDMTIEYNINCTDFVVPAMTVQPLVENAVRHGLLPLESGGRVVVSTYEDRRNNYIKVEDNGVGFDVKNPKPKYEDNRNHIGISNIRERLEIMCDGTLDIQSEIGKGTTVTLKIPKESRA